MRAGDLGSLIAGTIIGDPDAVVDKAADVELADEHSVVFAFSRKILAAALNGKAAVIICAAELSLPEASPKTFIQTSTPRLAMAAILERFAPERPESGVHPTAVLGEGVRLEDRVTIGAYCVVGAGVTIGEDTVLCSHVVLYPNVTLGARVTLHSGAVIGADGFGFERTQTTIVKIPQIGTVIIEDDVEIGANSTVDRATIGTTRIGAGSKIDNLVQIAHNCQIGKRCLIAAHCAIGGSAVLDDDVTIAGFVAVSDHIHIGKGSMVGGRACVIGDIGANEMVSGFPARNHREEMKFWAKLRRMAEGKSK